MVTLFCSWAKLAIDFVNKRPKTKFVLNAFLIILIGWLFIAVFSPKVSSQDLNFLNAERLITLTNQERLNHNLPPLFPNETLTKAATNKANNLLKGQYFSHDSPEGRKFSDWVKEVNYPYSIVGENLAEGFVSYETIVQVWMASPDHRQNILHPEYKEIGIAVLKGNFQGRETKMVVQLFGSTLNYKLSEIFIPYQDSTLKEFTDKLNCYS